MQNCRAETLVPLALQDFSAGSGGDNRIFFRRHKISRGCADHAVLADRWCGILQRWPLRHLAAEQNALGRS